MLIPKTIPTLWYEDKDGKKYYPDVDEAEQPPKGYHYMYTMNVMTMHDEVLAIICQEDVDVCDHKKVKTTYGWIDGHEGRECIVCGGTQSKLMYYDTPSWWPSFLRFPEIHKPWSKKWVGQGSKSLVKGETGIAEDLLLALIPKYGAHKAMLIAGVACERCHNSLLWEFTKGIKDKGYPEFSEEWKECGTSCIFCEHMNKEDNDNG